MDLERTIDLNDTVKKRFIQLFSQRANIEKRIGEDINLIVESLGLAKEGAKYTIDQKEFNKIIIQYK
jgi:hypothetical protein